jgi:hypothetical protein
MHQTLAFLTRRRVLVLLTAGLVLGAAGLFILWASDREPAYQGRKLSEWLAAYGSAFSDGPRTAAQEQAAEAIRHIGTNGLPSLLAWFLHEPPSGRGQVMMVVNRIRWLRPLEKKMHQQAVQQSQLRTRALSGFAVLGASAKGAVPQLAEALRKSKSRASCLLVIDALSFIGNDALPALVTVVSNPSHPSRLVALQEISQMASRGADSRAVVAVLVQCLQSKDPQLAQVAASELGNLELEPEIVVPALAASLQDSRETIRVGAAEALGQFGTKAHPALPALRKALGDPSEAVRAEAAQALKEIGEH